MMIKDKIVKLKKYLFLISILLFVVLLSHLGFLYIYHDAKLEPIKGGKISEGLIGNFPSLNPLKPLNGNNKYIVNLLYRSLLTYDISEGKISSDLASCDISNLLYIECYIKDNIQFSDGKTIDKDDILATYKVLQNTGTNPITQSLLAETTIEHRENIITFSNPVKDVNFLNVLFQPIVSKEVLDTLGEDQLKGNFPPLDQIYSGDFKIANVEQDLSLGVTKFLLEKNIFSENQNIFIDQFEIKLFPDTQSFLKNKETVNIFNDTNNLIGRSLPRFEVIDYTLPQFVGVFLNQNNISSSSLRSLILDRINRESLLNILGKANYQGVINPYMSEFELSKENGSKNVQSLIEKLGYYKKSKIIAKYLPEKSADFYSQEANLDKSESIDVPEEVTLEQYQKDSLSIMSPEYVDKYNFVTKGDILLQGATDTNTQAVYINDYKLQSYSAGNKYFYYRLRESYNTLKKGENNYKIYFEINGEKKLKEEVTFFYESTKEELATAEKTLIETLYKEEQEEKRKKEALEQKEIASQPINTTKVKQISALDEKYYYNDKLEAFTLKIYYLATEPDLERTGVYIQSRLEELGIASSLRPVSLRELSSVLREKDQYDILVAGINLGFFDYNIFPYFHSSQSKNGYNFSNIRKTSLDILLEDLKSSIVKNDSSQSNQEKVLKVLQEEQIVKTLYTPKLNLLIDKNIKHDTKISSLPNKELRSKLLNNTYIKEKNIINLEDKSFFQFIKFLFSKINE